MVERFNASLTLYRASYGLPALNLSPTLGMVAKRRSELAGEYYFQSGLLAHDNPNISGDRYFELLPVYGISFWDWAGENLYLTNATGDPVQPAIDAWIASPTHNANLLGTWNDVGFGITSQNGFYIIASIFLDRSG